MFSLYNHKHAPMRVYLAFNAIWSLALTTAFTIFSIYLVLARGLDPLQLVLVGTALEVAAFLFEVPTGVVADTVSRRLSVVIGVVLMGLSFFIVTSSAFVVILFSQVVLGLGWTFVSGANSAWITDEIGEEAAGKAFLRASQAGLIGGLAGTVIGVAFGMVDLRLPLVLGGLTLIALGGYLILFMPETGFQPAPAGERETFKTMLHTTRDGFKVIRGKPVLMTLIVIIFLYGAFSESLDRLWTLHILDNFSLPALGELDQIIWFGIIGIVSTLIGLGVTEFVRRRMDTADQTDLARTLTRVNMLLIVGILAFAFTQNFALALAAFWIIGAMRGIQIPLREAWINQGLPSKVRATVLSMTNQADAIGQIAGGPGVGWIGRAFGVRIALAIGSIILLPTLILYGRTVRQNTPLIDADAVPALD